MRLTRCFVPGPLRAQSVVRLPDESAVHIRRVLRLRTGQLVALIGERNPQPSRFLILRPDAEGQQDPAHVIDYLVRYTGLPLETEGIGSSMTELTKL